MLAGVKKYFRRFHASLSVAGSSTFLGSFPDVISAAKAYDR